MLNQLDIDEFNFDELKNLKVEDVTKDVFVDFFKKCLNDDSKNTVLGWDSYIKKQIEINKIQTEVNGILAGNMSGLKKFIDSMNTKNVDNLNKQEISELTENNDWKNFLSTGDGQRVTELLSEMQKIEQINYEDKEESEDEKLKFVLQYV